MTRGRSRVQTRPEYALVPDGRDAGGVDPYWQELQRRSGHGSTLPSSYLPPSMPGQVRGWRRTAAWVLIVMLTSAAAGGVCLTYGPDELFALLRAS